MAVNQRFTASRNATWGPTLTYDYRGPALPLAGATITMQLRLYPGQPGEAKLAIPNVPFSDAIIAGTAGEDDEVRRLTLEPVLTVAQLTTLPGLNQPEAGDPQGFAFDFRIDYADDVWEVLSSGTIIVSPGVTV